MKTLNKKMQASRQKIAIVVSKFNEFITKRLLDGCLKELKRLGARDRDITIAEVPGSLEIPVAALKCARKKSIDAVICLGAVIRGETIHFDLVAHNAARGIAQVSLLTGKPVIFGVLAVDTVNQAYKRSEAKGDNKGRDAAAAAVEMIEVLNKIRRKK